MGKMWNALRRGDVVASETEGPRTLPAPVEDAEPLLAAAEEIPFIEVGPQKSIEASPSVLACSPHVAGPSRALRTCGKAAAAPQNVPFRTVFLAALDTEPDTPQTDTIIPQ